MSRRTVRVQPEQILVVHFDGHRFFVGGQAHGHIPWGSLGMCHLYALNIAVLERMLIDAHAQGYMILDGAKNERRGGFRSFTVGIGAWGHRGRVDARIVDHWFLTVNEYRDPLAEAERCERALRKICLRLNAEQIPWRPAASTWTRGVRRCFVLDDEDSSVPLPEDVEVLCRRAHVDGPQLHLRTSLRPFVHIDRDRAYGSAMLEDLPSGRPFEVEISSKNSLARWTPRDLMNSTSILDATIEIFDGPFVSLIPLHRNRSERNTSLFPTGILRGAFTSIELADLETSGGGYVKQIHRAVKFTPRPALAPVIRYLRRLEGDFPSDIPMKHLEHVVYGSCARSLSVQRFSSGTGSYSPLLGDLVSPDLLRRLRQGATVKPMALDAEVNLDALPHRLYEVKGALRGLPRDGSSSRPDRAAFITAMNRVGISDLIRRMNAVKNPRRSGDFVGRVYVDGLDIEASPGELPELPGASVRYFGPEIRIYRSGAFFASLEGGGAMAQATGIRLPELISHEDFEAEIRRSLDVTELGVLSSGGRVWPTLDGVDDPRMLPDARSEPLSVDLALLDSLGFLDEAT